MKKLYTLTKQCIPLFFCFFVMPAQIQAKVATEYTALSTGWNIDGTNGAIYADGANVWVDYQFDFTPDEYATLYVDAVNVGKVDERYPEFQVQVAVDKVLIGTMTIEASDAYPQQGSISLGELDGTHTVMLKWINDWYESDGFNAGIKLTAVNTGSAACTKVSESFYASITDGRGRIISTKKDTSFQCIETKTDRGGCAKWDEEIIDMNLTEEDYNKSVSENYSGTLGAALEAVKNQKSMDQIWTGWRGYCEKGTFTDFDWMNDPYAVGSMLLSSYGGEIAGGMGGVIANNADEAVCIANAAIDLAKDVSAYFEDDLFDCDPVDDICDEESGSDSDGGIEPQTFDQNQLDLFRQQLTDEGVNPDDIIVILEEDNGIYLIKMDFSGVANAADAKTQKEMEEAMQAQKELQLKVSSAVNAAKVASCLASGNSSAADTSNGLSAATALEMAVSYYPGDPMTKLGLMVAMKTINSMEQGNSCSDEEFAEQQGTRHKKTAESLPYGLCHKIEDKCEWNDPVLGECRRTSYTYCCYDSKLTRILVEQMYAQRGYDWAHCNALSVNDLSYAKFEQCTPDQRALGFDGANQKGIYDPLGAYQLKAQCMDMEEFQDYLVEQFGTEVPTDFVQESLESLRPKVGTTGL